MVVGHPYEHGLIESINVYDPPLTDVAPQGQRGLVTGVEYESLDQMRGSLPGVLRAV
jgi:hypothetical protein